MSNARLKHDWASLQSYLNAHERVLRKYAVFMDYPRQYSLKWLTANYMILECHGIKFSSYNGTKICIDLSKDVEIDDEVFTRKRAKTVGYSYNASRPQIGNLIRYDSPDLPQNLMISTPLHHYYHHKHIWKGGVEFVNKIGENEWPHVSEFLHEVLSDY